MPIKYQLGSLVDFMSYEGAVSFYDAVQELYGIDLSPDNKEPVLQGTVKHGT